MAVAAIAARWLISISLLSASLSSAALLPSLGQVPDLRRDLGIDLGLDLEPSLVTYTHTYTHTVTSCPSTTSAASQATGYYSPAFIPAGDGLQPALSQSQTNGDSAWGTLNASALPVFLNTSGGVSSHGFPWGSATANNTDQYTYTPNTNVTRKYVFTVSSGTIAPDGVEKSAILINGAFPGPLIEANWGDMIEVEVTNNLTTEGTSMHWHGLLQKDTPWMDGVPGTQTCPIAPGRTFTYRFRADLYGTTWYHSHYSAQYAGGAVGPLVVYGPKSATYDVDIGPVMLSDWYHKDYFTLVEQTMSLASLDLGPPVSNNNLINGKMNYPCANTTLACTANAGVSKFKFTSGKKHLIRLINSGAEGLQKFSIDNHTMTVIAHDFVPMHPYETSVVTLGVGQRTDIIVEATGSSTDVVWMRSSIGETSGGGCSIDDDISYQAVAAIYYENANTTAVPKTATAVTTAEINTCANDALSMTKPFYSITPDPNPPVTQDISITFGPNTTDSDTAYDLWYINNSSFRADYNDPVLLESKLGNLDFASERNVYNFGSNSSIRLVIYSYFTEGTHPIHLHGHNMFVLAEGFGTWDGVVTNPTNPNRRDVQLVQKAKDDVTPAYIVVQIDADNPGVWPVHCHIAWHVSAGLYFNILERPDDIEKYDIPSSLAQTCRDWSAYTGVHVVDEIDSGL